MIKEDKVKEVEKGLKDLAPENKRKRKEPPRPWGKRERLLVFSALVLSIVASSLLALSNRNWKLPGFPRIDFSAEETITYEKNQPDVVNRREKENKIKKDFIESTKDKSGLYGLYVYDLTEKRGFGVNQKELMTAASLIKLPVMAALFWEKPAGYKDLLSAMGKRSDNSAFGKARRILGDIKINDIIKKIGMTKTILVDNVTTPEEIGLFFKKLFEGQILPKNETDEFLESLTDTIYEDWIAAGVPDGVRVAHKYGREVHVINDAGIIFANDPFILVIMTEGVVEKEADLVIPGIAEEVYRIETSKD